MENMEIVENKEAEVLKRAMKFIHAKILLRDIGRSNEIKRTRVATYQQIFDYIEKQQELFGLTKGY